MSTDDTLRRQRDDAQRALVRERLDRYLEARGVDPDYRTVHLDRVADRIRVSDSGEAEIRFGDEWKDATSLGVEDLGAEIDAAVPAKWRTGQLQGGELCTTASAPRARLEARRSAPRTRPPTACTSGLA